MNEVYVASQNELPLVLSALKQAYPDLSPESLMRVYQPANLPVLLGMRPLAANGGIPSGAPLLVQLYAMKLAHPALSHFRLLLINGFGANLGDNLIGQRAFSHVLSHIRTVLPEVSVDVMLGIHGDDRLERLYRNAEGIERVLTSGMSLGELAHSYQGIFDCGELLSQPRYGSMPMVDWYMWWMGIDPSGVADADKRNRISVPDPARKRAAELMEGEGMRIAINPKASVPLRSVPASAMSRLVDHILTRWPEARVVSLQPLEYDHPRFTDLSARITDIDILAAVVERCDALIGADTYTQHLADALDVPAVTFYTSVSPELYPYYPLVEPVMLPDAERLPAWGKMKTSPGAWKVIGHFYDEAWDKLEPGVVLSALKRAMERKADRLRSA